MDLEVSMKPVRLFFETVVPDNYDLQLPPIVLLHGLYSIHTTWGKVKHQIAASTRRQVFAVDLRNHGQSEWSDTFSMDEMILDLDNFLSARSIGKAIFVGHSLGGRLAGAYAMKKPEKVEKLVVEESTFNDPSEDDLKMFESTVNSIKKMRFLPRDLTEKEVQTFLRQMVGKIYSPQAFPFKDSVMIPFHKGPDGRICFDFNIEVLEKSLVDKSLITIDSYKPAEMPVLFLYGERSLIKNQKEAMMPEYFRNSRVSIIKNSAHMPHLESPEEFISAVSSFINGS